MFFFCQKKNIEKGVWKPIKVKTLEKAEEWLKAYILVSAKKSKISDFKIISKEEYNNILLEKEEQEKKALKLDDRAMLVVKNVLCKNCAKITKDDIKTFSLQEGTTKPYYALCYWGNGSNGSFCTKEELKDLYAQQAQASYDDGFDISVYDVDNDTELSIHAEFSVTLTGF